MPIDYKKYPPNWKTEIRPFIMNRANNTCENEGCDFKHHEMVWSCLIYRGKTAWVRKEEEAKKLSKESGWNCEISFPIIKKIKVVLTIAHLDHDELNHDVKMNRLAALCQLCHLRYDAKEKYRRVMKK